MGWEKMNEHECKCPCGKGRIYTESYSDDWNRYETRGPYIECDECKNRYHIESFHYNHHPGKEYSIHYCVANDYPAYSGTPYHGKFTFSYNVKDVKPVQYFVENYSLDSLHKVLDMFEQYKTYKNIPDTGSGSVAREIVRRYKSWYNTQRIKTISEVVSEAIHEYYSFELQFDTIAKGKAEHETYMQEKKDNSIRLDL